MENIFLFAATVISAVILFAAYLPEYGAVFQQCGYRIDEFSACFSHSLKKQLIKSAVSSLSVGAIALAVVFFDSRLLVGLTLLSVSSGVWIYFASTRKIRVKASYTKRYTRIVVVACLLDAACVAIVSTIVNECSAIAVCVCLSGVLSPLWLILSKAVNTPIDAALYAYYTGRAKRLLRERSDLLKIAVTGSCGKTTVKNYLATFLSARYDVLATPASYNTPLGVCRALNGLTPSNRVLIAEMGARRKGDITELCRIVKPDVTVVTGITEQHLQTFGSLENVIREKRAAVDALGKDGIAVISGDTKGSLEIFVGAACHKVLVGVNGKAYYRAENIVYGRDGTTFDFTVGKERYPVKTKLFGRHNVTDFLLAAATAIELGVSAKTIASLSLNLKPPKHRFEVFETKSGITVIDDGYNANIEGLKCAAQALKVFDGDTIAVTCGIVEGGNASDRLNFAAGEILGLAASTVIAVGSNAELISDGARKSGARVFTVVDLDGAKSVLSKIVKRGDVVLFANDSPDRY